MSNKSSIKRISVIVAIPTVIAYVVIILLVANSHKLPEQGFVASATYYPTHGSVGIAFEDTSNHTKGGHIYIEKVDGERWDLTNFTGSNLQQVLMTNANKTQSLPMAVTFDLELIDGTKVSKTFNVKIDKLSSLPLH